MIKCPKCGTTQFGIHLVLLNEKVVNDSWERYENDFRSPFLNKKFYTFFCRNCKKIFVEEGKAVNKKYDVIKKEINRLY